MLRHFQQIRSNIKTDHNLFARVFPRLALMIGQSYYFGFDFTALNWKLSYHYQTEGFLLAEPYSDRAFFGLFRRGREGDMPVKIWLL